MNDYSQTDYMIQKINIELVAADLRPAFFPQPGYVIKELIPYAESLGVHLIKVPLMESPVYTKNVESVNDIKDTGDFGKALGYVCYSNEFAKSMGQRTAVRVMAGKLPIWSEVCQPQYMEVRDVINTYAQKIRKMNERFPEYKFDFLVMPGV